MDEPASSPDESTGDYDALEHGDDRRAFHLEIDAITDPGLARENNEDNYFVARLNRSIDVEMMSLSQTSPTFRRRNVGYLLIVADGMGGVEGGERASELAVETIVDFFRSGFSAFLQTEQSDEAALYRELKTGIERADHAVIKAAAGDPKLNGMGTTLTMAYAVADTLYILHVGDSRAYLFRDQTLRQITTDHTLVQMLVESRSITVEDARTHPKRNVVTNVVGGPDEGIYVETHTLQLLNGDLVLLCSDGLTEPLDHATIASVLASESDPSEAMKILLDKALEAGAPDNVTIVLARAQIETSKASS